MTTPPVLAEQITSLDSAATMALRGRVSRLRGLALRVADLPVPVGSMVRILAGRGRGPVLMGEVVGFEDDHTIVMPFGSTSGVSRGDDVIADRFAQWVEVGPSLLGRVVDGLGRPIDGKGPIQDSWLRPLIAAPIDPLDRPPIDMPLATGVRAVDALMSVGRGQRLGVFASPGVGKSTLLAQMTRHTAADISIVALVGERGREVRDFIDRQLGPEGMARSVVIAATSDEPALMRIRAALVATTIAEFFRHEGCDVLLIMDSITRFCQAQRQIGLAADEPPATKGYPPSVFAMLPNLLERSGRTSQGSITGLYAVLTEGDELTDPITDAARGVLDGHIQLSRDLAHRGHWPAIDVLASVSRVADQVTTVQHRNAALQIRRLLAAYRQVEDLVNIGAYAAGSNPDYDLAIACKPAIDRLLQQGGDEVQGRADFQQTSQQLLTLNQQMQLAKQQLSRATATPAATGPPPGRSTNTGQGQPNRPNTAAGQTPDARKAG